jgi:hypothetical protein
MRRILFAVCLVLTSLAFDVPQAAAIRPTTGLHLDAHGTRFYDSREAGAAMTDGVQRALTFGISRPLANITLSATTESWLYLHTCGTPPDRTQPAANHADAGSTTVNLVPIDVPGGACMTMYGSADVIVDFVGNEDGNGGLNYVAHDEPAEFDVTPTLGRTHIDVDDSQVPPGAQAVAVWVSIVADDSTPTAWTATSCDSGTDLLQFVTAPAGGYADNVMILPVGVDGDICFDSIGSAIPVDATITRMGYLAPGVTPTAEGIPYRGFVPQRMPGFTALSPERLFDTRDRDLRLIGGGVYRFELTDLPDDASAVAINVTVTQTTGAGFVSVYPCDGDLPEVSNVNFTGANQTVPNFAIVSVGFSRAICFYASTSTHVLADLSGYFGYDLGDGFVPQSPVRRLDTRFSTPVAAGTVREHSFPISLGTSAIVMNVTVTEPDRPGFVTVYPCDAPRPLASNLNFLTGQTRPNLVTVRLPANARVCFYSSARVHLIADVAGSYAPTSDIGFIDEAPWRVFDTRDPYSDGKLEGQVPFPYDIGDPTIEAVAWNMTATQPTGPGFVSAYPCGDTPPTVSNLNYSANETVANFAIVRPSSDSELCMLSLVPTHLIADEAGVFTGPVATEVYYEGDPFDYFG